MAEIKPLSCLSLRFFINLVRDELKEKYKGTKLQRYAVINWMKAEKGWT